MTIKEKKRAMLHYTVWLARQKDIEDEITQLRASQMSASARIGDGLPHAHDPKGLEDYAAQLDNLVRKLNSTKWACVNARLKVEIAINSLQDPREQRLMWLRYVKCLPWHEIADQMEYEERQIYRLHGTALLHIEIPDMMT